MNSLKEDIKTGKFKKVYLLCGEEAYLRIQYRDKLVNAVIDPEDTINRSSFAGKNVEEQDIIDMGETMPFFADKRLILIQDTGFFKKSMDRLPAYLAKLPDYLHIVFEESEVDKRNALYKAVKKYGSVVEFNHQEESTLVNWIAKILANAGKKIRRSDAEYLLSRVGNDMNAICLELDKVINYTEDREIITRQDIDIITTQQLENKIFDMINLISQKRMKEALVLYADLIALKESPLGILALLERQYNKMLRVSELKSADVPYVEIAKKVGMPSFAVRNMIGNLRQYSHKSLTESLEKCARTEQDIKTGNIDGRVGVELLIIEFSSVNG